MLVVIHNYIIMLPLLLVKSIMQLLLTIIILVCLAHFVIENYNAIDSFGSVCLAVAFIDKAA